MREARRLQEQNDRMRLEAYQRTKAREAGAEPMVAAETSAPKTMAPSVVPAGAATSTPRPVEYYRNEGNATPVATLQTFAWACDRGDTELVSRLLFIEVAARPKAEAFMASLPGNLRAQWKTVDQMAAAILTESIMAQPFPNADILETATSEQVGADRVRLRMPTISKDGTEYQKTADGWKYVITEKVVDNYLRHVAEQAKAGR